MKWKIRQEADADIDAITDIVNRAFAGKAYAGGDEADILNGLRDGGGLVLSLVAVLKENIIGQVALSPAKIGTQRYLCVGPLSVTPQHQGQGVGSALMGHALGVAQSLRRDGVVLAGDANYYARFGFEKAASVTHLGKLADHILVLPFTGAPAGGVTFHPAFNE